MSAASAHPHLTPLNRAIQGGGPPFGPSRDEAGVDHQLALDLHRALEEEQLEVRYQPILEMAGLGLWGCEALCRWDHPQHGPIPPDRFISLAEASGLIVPLGAWVLEESCRALKRWRSAGLVDDGFHVSVNITALELADDSFVDDVEAALARSGVPAHCLQLEVTERIAVEAITAAQGLRELGVRLALDDFGQGYASLALLRRLRVDVLKIDRSLTRDLVTDGVAQSLVRTVLFLAHSLDQEVIVEGIETAQQLRLLREMGCGLGQGYLFARALSAEKLAGVARARRGTLTFDPGKLHRSILARAHA